MEDCRKHIERKPSEYLSNFYYDTITYQPPALAYAVNVVGGPRVTTGTDYPFAIADGAPVTSVNAAPGLNAAERTAMCVGTAAMVLGLAR